MVSDASEIETAQGTRGIQLGEALTPLFNGHASSSSEPNPPATPPEVRHRLPASWESPTDWVPEHNINPHPIRRKVLGGLLIAVVALVGVEAVRGAPSTPVHTVPRAPVPSEPVLPTQHGISCVRQGDSKPT